MKTHDLEQGSEAWLAWRNSGWSASDASIIMGCAPSYYEVRTWEDLRMRRLGMADDPNEWAQEAFAWGHEREGPVRDWVNEHLDTWFAPACVSNGKFLASLDGLDHDVHEDGEKTLWLEIKCPLPSRSITNKRWYDGVRAWKDLPDYHKWQTLHQFAALNVKAAKLVYAIQTPEEEEPILIEADFCTQIMGPLVDQLWGQWKAWEDGEDPGRTDGEWYCATDRYFQAKKDYDAAKAKLDAARSDLVGLCDDGLSLKYGLGWQVSRQTRKGGVDTKRMEQDGIDVDAYRKDPTESWVVRRKS